jgi:hypothetical protein
VYAPYNLDLVRSRQQELIAEVNRGQAAKAARQAHRDCRRELAGQTESIDGRQSTARPGLALRTR